MYKNFDNQRIKTFFTVYPQQILKGALSPKMKSLQRKTTH